MKTTIGYKELQEDLLAVDKAYEVDPLSRYSIDIEGNMKTVPALRVLTIIDNAKSFQDRAQFVKELLNGCRVTVYKDGNKMFDVGISQGMEWWAVDDFNKEPLALRYVVTSVYTRFLKNFVA